jgi:hypothetical protein
MYFTEYKCIHGMILLFLSLTHNTLVSVLNEMLDASLLSNNNHNNRPHYEALHIICRHEIQNFLPGRIMQTPTPSIVFQCLPSGAVNSSAFHAKCLAQRMNDITMPMWYMSKHDNNNIL